MKKKGMGLIESLPNIMTTINILMGISAILLTIGEFNFKTQKLACIFILIGVFADALDGKLARLLNAESEFGKQLDSFADSITFGIAPMAVLFSYPQLQGNLVLLISLIIYPLAGIFRLARFNLGDFRNYFLGLPITAAGAIVALYNFLLFYRIYVFGDELPPFTAFLLFSLSALMISSIEVPKISLAHIFKKKVKTETY